MADNVELDAGSGGATIATDEVTYSGDTAEVQVVRFVHISGSEGSKTVSELVKAEDAAHTSGDFGLPILGVRQDTPASLAGTDGDYTMLIFDSSGRLHVNVGNTVTVASHAVTNAGTFVVQIDGTALTRLTDIETNTDALAVVGNGAAATAQRVTLANDSTGIVSLTTSTASIGKLAANSGVDIGDVDVTSVVPGTGATNLGKAIDTATGGTDTGVLALATRDDALSALTPVEGDNVQLRTDANGALWVIHSGTLTVASHAVTNAGTFAVQVDGSALTALQLIDDVVFTDDAAFTAATSKVVAIGGIVTTDEVNSGDVGALAMLTNRQLKVTLYDSGGAELSVGGGTQYTEDAAAAANPVGNAIILVRADSLAGVTTTDGDNVATRGTDKGEMYVKHVDSIAITHAALTELAAAIDTEVQCDIVGALPAGANAIGKLAANSGVDIGDVDILSIAAGDNNIGNVDIVSLPASTNTIEVVGDAAHDAAVAGNPVLIGFESKDFDGSALPNAVSAEGEAVRAAASLSGVQYVMIVNEDGSAVGTINVNAHAVTNAGTFAVQVDGAALTALQLIDNPVQTDDGIGFIPGTGSVSMAGFLADESSTDSVDEGDVGAARMTLDRQIRVVNVHESNSIRAGSATLTPSFAAVAAATSGDNTLVTNSNGGKKVRVFAMALVATSAVSLYFTSDGAGTVKFGGSTNKIALAANGGFVLPFNPLGWFETAADHDLVMNLSGAVAVSGGLVYAEV